MVDETLIRYWIELSHAGAWWYHTWQRNWWRKWGNSCTSLLAILHFRLIKEQQTSCPYGVPVNWKTPSHIQESEGALKNNLKSDFETQKSKITKAQDKTTVLKWNLSCLYQWLAANYLILKISPSGQAQAELSPNRTWTVCPLHSPLELECLLSLETLHLRWRDCSLSKAERFFTLDKSSISDW